MSYKSKRLEHVVSFPKDDSEWFPFVADYFEEALLIRRYMNELEPHTTTFKLDNIDGIENSGGYIPVELMEFLGTWKAPECIVTSARGRPWVNPNAEYALHYSDAITTCGCGVPVLREVFGENMPQPRHHQDHEDDCNKIKRYRARIRLLENRRDIIKKMVLLGKSMRSISHRLGYEIHSDVPPTIARETGLDIEPLVTKGRERQVRTMAVLLREHSSKEIGEVFDVHQKSVTEMVKIESNINPSTLYSVRRRINSDKEYGLIA